MNLHGQVAVLTGAAREADAILATWFLGSETGNAIADILFGAKISVGAPFFNAATAPLAARSRTTPARPRLLSMRST